MITAAEQSLAFGAGVRPLWYLDDDAVFLNHGSFGATPRSVLVAQDGWRARLERQPVQFMVRELPDRMRGVAAELGAFIGAHGDDLAWVDNATTGVNAVVASLRLSAGDELVTTAHVYGAVRKTLAHFAGRAGATVIEASVPYPLASPDQVVDAVAAALGPNTRIAILDHITSFSGAIYPIERLIELCRERGVPVLVDGAHAPGMVGLDLNRLGADWYVGNCHKWLFAPKGCAFLWARRDRQAELHPTVISHGWGQGFIAEFDFTGTRDPSPWLSLSDALRFARQLGIEAISAYNRDLVERAAAMLADRLQCELPTPAPMRGFMATLPHPWTEHGTDREARALMDAMWARHRIEVPVQAWGGRCWFRISAQVYNHFGEYEQLARVLCIRRDRGRTGRRS